MKSTVQSKDFKQLAIQCEAFSKMKNTAFINISENNRHYPIPFAKGMPPPLFLIAADSNLSVDTLKDELNKLNGVRGILIINQCLLFKNSNGDPNSSLSDIERIVRFWAVINTDCQDLSPYLKLTKENEDEILDYIKNCKGIDTENPVIKSKIIKNLKRPSLYPYLYPEELGLVNGA